LGASRYKEHPLLEVECLGINNFFQAGSNFEPCPFGNGISPRTQGLKQGKNNNMDDIAVVHIIPKWPCGGMAPRVQLGIMAGQYNRTAQPELKRRFEKQRLLGAVECNAERNGTHAIRDD
jgi:hypothetical protein